MKDELIYSDIISAKGRNPVTINLERRNVRMHYVFEHELETLGNVNFQAALHMALFGVSVGAAISFGVTTATVEIANPYTYAAFLCLTVLSCLMTFYFGIRSLIDFMNAKKQLNALKQVRENSESAL